mgnify:CR=1 FL=1
MRGQLPASFAIEVDSDGTTADVGDAETDATTATAPDAAVVEQHIPHASFDLNAIAQCEYRLVDPNICHMCVEEDMAVLYHCAQNSTYYLAEEEGCITFDLAVAPAVEFLIKSYPAWSSVDELPVGGAAGVEGQDHDDEEEEEDTALSMSLCAMLVELTRIGIVQSRNIKR